MKNNIMLHNKRKQDNMYTTKTIISPNGKIKNNNYTM